MSRLAALQRAFQRHVYRPGGAMERAVAPGPRASAARRLEVYANAYRARLVEALEADYPALRVQLGKRRFEALMREFIAAHPSCFANLRWYGAELARFLARKPRQGTLAELAAFEWALGHAFDAADARPVRAAELAGIAATRWPGLRFHLHPSARRLSLRSNAPSLWRAAIREGRRAAPRQRGRARVWLVWRRGFKPFYRALAPEEAGALDLLARGGDFAALCAALARRVGTSRAAGRAAQLLGTWIDEGLLCARQTGVGTAEAMSVRAKSSPLYSSGRPRTFASA